MPKSQQNHTDTLYRQPRESIPDFAFDEAIVQVYPDMIRRSVPAYEAVVKIAGLIAASRIRTGGKCFDLGCSRGATTKSILHAVGHRDCSLIAVDASEPMIAAARREVTDPRVDFRVEDIRNTNTAGSDAVTMTYVMQFVPREDREGLLQSIRSGLVQGGVLVVSEKVFSGQEFVKLHEGFKKLNGYNELEVAQKRQALANVMQVDSVETHLSRLERVGFRNVQIWFQCLNWISFLAEP